MQKFLMKKRLKDADSSRMSSLAAADTRSSKKILFSLFSRYGDAVIALKVMGEFMGKYPDKEYLLITSNQLYPYAKRMIGGKAEIVSLDKRRNPVKLLSTVKKIKERGMDLGLNPFSLGDDSEYFISFAKKYFPFKGSRDFCVAENLYEVVRRYLALPAKAVALKSREPAEVQKILIAPSSSNVVKSLDASDIKKLANGLKARYPGASVTVAVDKEEKGIAASAGVDTFIFSKSKSSSEGFMELLTSADLFVAVDAGPLHLADALGKPTIGIFGPTSPETIIDKDSTVVSLRNPKLNGTYCFVQSCKNPVCIHSLFDGDFLDTAVPVDFSLDIKIEEEKCLVV
ncbi:MAG: glycosyltransferase family 9 protein [Thermodesulfobacteriota bacterium]